MADHSPGHSRYPSIHFNVRNGEEDSPIEEVRLTMSTTLPALTFRKWVLGLASCILLSLVNQFFNYRQNPLSITSVSVPIIAPPLGKPMAATLPSKPIKVPLMGWSFLMNPGPFNLKEHVLITIFANAGANGVYALHVLASVKAYYHWRQSLNSSTDKATVFCNLKAQETDVPLKVDTYPIVLFFLSRSPAKSAST
ncbi:hypothetical protein CRG98_023353 [Punica granatum]|uniref:Uncharacterized protein n=1 Tax=Punica granatum TaxID=22663 RepID=A0A2I0JJ92_PUNGR|nr:hypothetical protein CRG98_023353 [Punica granatum]